MKNIYLAANYARNAEMREYREVLVGMGYRVTSRWIDQHADTGQLTEALGEVELNANPELGTPFALKDLDDIQMADTVVMFSGAGRGGRHTEYGMAWAFGKQMFIVGKREHVFHCLPGVKQFYGFDEFVEYLQNGATQEG